MLSAVADTSVHRVIKPLRRYVIDLLERLPQDVHERAQQLDVARWGGN